MANSHTEDIGSWTSSYPIGVHSALWWAKTVMVTWGPYCWYEYPYFVHVWMWLWEALLGCPMCFCGWNSWRCWCYPVLQIHWSALFQFKEILVKKVLMLRKDENMVNKDHICDLFQICWCSLVILPSKCCICMHIILYNHWWRVIASTWWMNCMTQSVMGLQWECGECVSWWRVKRLRLMWPDRKYPNIKCHVCAPILLIEEMDGQSQTCFLPHYWEGIL